MRRKRLIRIFREMHRRKFGGDISAKDAERDLSNLMELIRLITKEKNDDHNK